MKKSCRWAFRHGLAGLLIGAFAATASASPSASTPLSSDPFATGSRYWSATAGASADATLGWIYLGQAAVDYYVADRLAVEYGGLFGYANANRMPSGVLGGIELGMRWHMTSGPRWSTYVEGLAGAVYQQYPLTPPTLRFNFDLQPGLGATYRLSNTTMCRGGFRWHHLSNSQVRGRAHNFGYDGPLLYLGLLQSF